MLGTGSRDDDYEVRLSLRSFAQNYACEGARFWVIGHIPHWLDQNAVRCIPYDDPYRHNKDANLLRKAFRMAHEAELSDPFILCSDDHLLLKSSRPEDFGWWHCGVPGHPENGWRERVDHSLNLMRERGIREPVSWEGHIPYVLKKEWLLKVERELPWEDNVTIFTTILNYAGVSTAPEQHINNQRIRGWLGEGLSAEALASKTRPANNQFLTLDGGSLKSELICQRLREIYPQPRHWEMDAGQALGGCVVEADASPQMAEARAPLTIRAVARVAAPIPSDTSLSKSATADCLHYCIAFSRPEEMAYRWQAVIWLKSLVDIGRWAGRIVVFTNDPEHPLRKALPAHVAERVEEIIIDFDDFSVGKDGKLPSCRWRMEAPAYLKEHLARTRLTFYNDTDCVCRRPLDPLFVAGPDSMMPVLRAPGVFHRNRYRGTWFGAHFMEPHHRAHAEHSRGVQGGSVISSSAQYATLCELWAAVDVMPGRPGLMATDQSSLNLLATQCELGELPWKFTLLPWQQITCPQDQRRHDPAGVDQAYIWHWWGLRGQTNRVIEAKAEYERRLRQPLVEAISPAVIAVIAA